MWNLPLRIAAAAISVGLMLSGCSEVRHPISPQQARAQVVDASRDVVNAVHGEVTEATFSYESCNDQGQPPFRGAAKVSFWVGGVPHDQPADPQAVIKALVADGWSTDSDFKSHSPTLRKGPVNIILTVPPQPPAGVQLKGHAWIDVDGECRDIADHRGDGSLVPVSIANEIQPQ